MTIMKDYFGDGRQILTELMAHRPAPRMGLFDSIWGDTVKRWTDEGYIVNTPEQPFNFAEHFGFDMAFAGKLFDEFPLRGFEEVEQETDEWRVIRNGSGGAHKLWKHKSGTPEHVDYRMTSDEIWRRDYREHLIPLDEARIDFDAYGSGLAKLHEQGKWAYHGCLFVFENMRRSMGDVGMLIAMAEDKAWIHDFCRVYTDFFIKHYACLFERCGAPDGVMVADDLGYNRGLFASPAMLEELVFPYYRELVDFLHSHGVRVILHSCGGVERALQQVVEVGYDALNPMEVKADCDVLRFAEQYHDKLCFVGGMDVRIFERGDRADIKREVLRLTEGMRRCGAGFLFGSDHSVSPLVDYEDYEYAVKLFRDNSHY